MLYAFGFERVGVVVADLYFLDPRPGKGQEGAEHGVRLELRVLGRGELKGSIYSAQPIEVGQPIWRADLLESVDGRPGSFDRTHHHPAFTGWNPGRRVFVKGLSADPLGWVGEQLADLDGLLASAGCPADTAGPDDADSCAPSSRRSWRSPAGCWSRSGPGSWATRRATRCRPDPAATASRWAFARAGSDRPAGPWQAGRMASDTTRRLMLLRHAKSDWPDVPDHDRPLARRGKHDAPLIGRWLRDHGYLPEIVVCSDARRTRQTWKLVARELGGSPEVRFDPRAYAASELTLLYLARELPAGCRSALLIGHNPDLSDLARSLAGPGVQEISFPTAAVAVLEFDGDWPGLAPGQARLLDFTSPASL